MKKENAPFWVNFLGLKPRIDGDQWYFLWGDNLQDGLSGFGSTVLEAMRAFDKGIEHRRISLRVEEGISYRVTTLYDDSPPTYPPVEEKPCPYLDQHAVKAEELRSQTSDADLMHMVSPDYKLGWSELSQRLMVALYDNGYLELDNRSSYCSFNECVQAMNRLLMQAGKRKSLTSGGASPPSI